MGTSKVEFRNSCVPILLKDCAAGTTLIDPCSCARYYECIAGFEVLKRSCAPGTLYVHVKGSCQDEKEILAHGICSINEPWYQCRNITGTNIPEIAKRCGGTATTSITQTSTVTPGQRSESGINAGLIAGIIAGLVLAIILVIIFIWYFKRKKLQKEKSGKSDGRNSSVMNPGYISHDDEYARADEVFTSPIYTTDTINTPPQLPDRPSSQQRGDHQNGKIIMDDGYVEPNATLKTEAEYAEVINDEDHSNEDDIPSVIPPTPYDNKFK